MATTDDLIKNVTKLYEGGESMRNIAKALNVSLGKVKKLLVTAGMFSNEMSEQIQALYKTMDVQEIAQTLGVSKSTVNMYIPYTRGTYPFDSPTSNAIALRKFHERNRNK